MASKKEAASVLWARVIVVGLVSLLVGGMIGLGVLMIFGRVKAPKPLAMGRSNIGRLGQYVHSGKLKIQVTAVRIDKVGQMPFVPGTDREFYVLNLRVGNLDDSAHWVTPVTEAYLIDNAQNKYQMEPAPVTAAFEAGSLAPDEVRTGEISFSVPQSARGLKLVYVDQLTQSAQPATIDLGR